MLPGTAMYVYLGSLVTSASQLASGQTRETGPLGSVLYWGGLAATLIVTIVITRIAKRALASAMDGTKATKPPDPETAT